MTLAAAVVLCAACRYEPSHESDPKRGEGIVSLLASFVEQDPDDYVSIYTLARVADRGASTREVIHWLRRLEATSWNMLIEDADFPKSVDDPRFQSIRDRLNARALVVHGAEDAFEIDQLDLLPEGMAYDPTTDRFLVSSGRHRKVVSVGRDGRSIDLVSPAQDGVLATLGMKVDDERRELWVASAAAPFMIDPRDEDAGRSSLYAFDADSGATKGRWDVAWTPSLLNDLVVTLDGAVFVTESMTGAVLRRIRGADSLDEFLPRETFFSPNGIALSADGTSLFVAHYHGISRVDVATRKVTPLDSDDRTLHLGGVDGLYVHEGRLVAIQNLAGKGRIWSLEVDGVRITKADILESGNASFRNPTTGAIAGGGFFFMSNPQLQVWDGGEVTAPPEGERLRVMWLPLTP